MTTTPKTLTTDECHRLLDALQIADGTPTQIRRGMRRTTRCLGMERE